jgi:cytochrome c oxidase subunit 2
LFSSFFIFNDAPFLNQYTFQDSATPLMEGIIDLHNEIFIYLISILIAVSWILIRIIMLFNSNNNIHVIHFTHNTLLEIIWTITPAFILMIISIPSPSLLHAMDEIIDPSVTVKAIGHQWYWSYEYSDYSLFSNQSIAFDSYMIPDDDLVSGQLRLLEVDNHILSPVNTHIRLLVSSTDVIHSWTIPSFGVKVDALPGRLNQLSIFVNRLGTFYGQCSEICGVNHGFMPIVVDIVNLNDYINWIYLKLTNNN